LVLFAQVRSLCTYAGRLNETLSDSTPRTWQVWRRGRLAHIEEPPGTMCLIAGERTYWRKWPLDPEAVALPRSPEHDDFELGRFTRLDPESYWREWLTLDVDLVLSTLRPTRHEDRDALTFTAPMSKGFSASLTVDRELGIVVSAEHPEQGTLYRWTELRATETPADFFRFSGPWARDTHRHYPVDWQPE